MADIVSSDLPLPNATGNNTLPEVPALIDSTNVNDLLQKAWRVTHKWLFASETIPIIESSSLAETKECDQHVEHLSLTYNFKPISFTRDDEGGAFVYFLEGYVQTLWDKFGDYDSQEHIIWGIYRLVCHILTPQFEDDSYPRAFREGFLNFVLLKEGIFPCDYRIDIAASVWYGPDMPSFLDWLEKEYGEGTIGGLIEAFGAPYNKSGFETVTGASISSLWERYHVSPYGKESENEELHAENKEPSNAEFSQLWPMPMLCHKFSWTPGLKQEWNDMFCNNLEPTGALTRALSAIFRHLYTPKTVPTSVRIFEDLCLVIRSGRMEETIQVKVKRSQCKLVISWDWITAEKPTITTIMEMLVLYMTKLYRRLTDSDKIDRDDDPLCSAQTMAAFVLMQEGFILPRVPGEQRSEDNDLESFIKSIITWKDLEIADFFCWIETTVGEGTVKNLYKRASRERLDPSWLVDPSGKSLRELYYEFERIFPPGEISESLVWQESHIDAIYLDESESGPQARVA